MYARIELNAYNWFRVKDNAGNKERKHQLKATQEKTERKNEKAQDTLEQKFRPQSAHFSWEIKIFRKTNELDKGQKRTNVHNRLN